ncbi:COG4315 family predicted lipoprotein [Aestuariispira insulae]|uniref:Putative lipoprotein with Yx(FWY)xxD motif n=1 Tax=Aestuariispira insulae TaxID=1461337 RepID=A0A3D9HE50_9PROT|nr:hypothetical protein [Aestuariispira insulae]RED47753.1 putative lipoprotein with Yx(FWY)xxD motif [Aestuariispira insulae]
MKIRFASILISLSLLAGCVSYGLSLPNGISVREVAGGKILTNEAGLTLYVFDLDLPGISNCYQDCATNWPPAYAADGAEAKGDFSMIPRKDGRNQWAYKEQPLYLFIKDKKPGDINGDGVRNVWYIVTMSSKDDSGQKSTEEGGYSSGY